MYCQGSDLQGKRKTTLTFAKVDSKAYAAKYTCQFKYTDQHNHEDNAEVVVRCKLEL